jgi:hypothetical protein
MRKVIYNKWLDIIADYYSGDYPEKDKALKAAIANAVASIPWNERRAILTDNMIYHGALEDVKDGRYGVAYYDAYNDLKKVYGEEFKDDVYVKKGGTADSNEWRYKNGKPYVWIVYCHQIAKALATYFKKEYMID